MKNCVPSNKVTRTATAIDCLQLHLQRKKKQSKAIDCDLLTVSTAIRLTFREQSTTGETTTTTAATTRLWRWSRMVMVIKVQRLSLALALWLDTI